jgi:hypothetical protein
VKYCERVFVALIIQHAMRMRHIALSGVPGFKWVFHIKSQNSRFWKKKKLVFYKMCVLIFSAKFL